MISLFLLIILVGAIVLLIGAAVAGAATFFPALLLFIGELWMTFFRAILALTGTILLFVFVMICGFIALGH